MKKFPFPLLLLSGLFGATSLSAQDTTSLSEEARPLSLFEYLHQQEDSIPLLELETDWGLLVRKKLEEEYQPGILRFRLEDGAIAELKVKVRARGNIRKEVCFYPPIKVKAKKKHLSALGFEPINDLKFVLPCKNGSGYEDCLAREALAYRLYEAIHPIHMKTKIIRLKCLQDDVERRSVHAFLVEDEEELSARLSAKVIDRGVLRSSVLERDAYLKMCFFQYMIANVDWSIGNRHNVEILAIPGFDRMIIVPYDFDYAGFTGTPYAVPAASLPIDDVNQRYFLGRKVTEEEALSTSKFFLSKKEEVLQLCQGFHLLEKKEKASINKYLAKFFDLLENEKKVLRAFANAD